MATILEKARKDPQSMKGRILAVARRLFGQYGFHGTTTRMIAQEVSIDMSTLHYHWGEKGDLYEAVVLDICSDLSRKLIEVEKIIHGLPRNDRLAISIEMMTDYLFDHPECSNLILFRYFGKTREGDGLDFKIPEFTADVARSMGLAKDRRNLSPQVRMEILALMNSIHNFVSGENLFRPMVGMNREDYIQLVKQTLKFIHLPAFAQEADYAVE
jgi:AcrR family transcriptional regulator